MSKYIVESFQFRRKLRKYLRMLKYVKKQKYSKVKEQLMNLIIESIAIVKEILRRKYEFEPFFERLECFNLIYNRIFLAKSYY